MRASSDRETPAECSDYIMQSLTKYYHDSKINL